MDFGFDCISMTYQNHKNPRFPLIITVYEEQGIFVDLSQCGGVLECHTDIPEVVKLVNDILNDKIIVALAYPDNVFAFHGVIEISNWSGSTYYKLYRK